MLEEEQALKGHRYDVGEPGVVDTHGLELTRILSFIEDREVGPPDGESQDARAGSTAKANRFRVRAMEVGRGQGTGSGAPSRRRAADRRIGSRCLEAGDQRP